MDDLNDETLMAYADGQLAPAQNACVEYRLANDPALGERLRIFKEAGRGLSLLFEDHLRAPMPVRLQPFATPIEEQQRTMPVIVERLRIAVMLARLQNLLKPEHSTFRLAFASSIALAVGIGLDSAFLRRTDRGGESFVQISQDRLTARGPLLQLLEAAPSGRAVQVSAEGTAKTELRVKLTFRNQTNHYCREYVIMRQPREGDAGIACRKDGQWRIAMNVSMMPSSNSSGTVPAGLSKSHQAVEAAVLAMINGESLDKDGEAAALRSGWEER